MNDTHGANLQGVFDNVQPTGTGTGAGHWQVWAGVDAAGFIDWRASRVELIAAARHGRGTIGAGGGRGVILRTGKRGSTAGGASVVGTQADRQALFAAQLLDRPAGWRAPFGCSVEPSAVAGVFGGLPAGGLFGELQGQADLALTARLAARLAASMRRDGRDMSTTTQADGASAGLVALARWRSINAKFPARRARGTAASVAWRAIVKEVSTDGLGEHCQPCGLPSDVELSNLIASALPLPPLRGDESRDDRASRLRYERARARRAARLAARFQSLAVGTGANGERRRQAVERVGLAVRAILRGESLEAAATAAGYKASGTGRLRRTAGDTLFNAVRRLGFKVQFSLRVRGKAIARPSLA